MGCIHNMIDVIRFFPVLHSFGRFLMSQRAHKALTQIVMIEIIYNKNQRLLLRHSLLDEVKNMKAFARDEFEGDMQEG